MWRLTASRFGEVAKATARRNLTKLCQSLVSIVEIKSKSIIHGKKYEPVAIKQFEQVVEITVFSLAMAFYMVLYWILIFPVEIWLPGTAQWTFCQQRKTSSCRVSRWSD